MRDFDESYYCRSCWDQRTSPAPERCKCPHLHTPSTAVKIGVVIEHADGTKTHLATEEFEYVDVEVNALTTWDYIYHTERDTGLQDIVISIRNVRRFVILKPDQQPSIDDGDTVEEA